MGRKPCCEKVGLKRGRWTSEEDDKLTSYILQHGQGSWRSLPQNAGLLRCGKSCRLRWINYLRSDLKREDITAQEEDTIIKLHASLGNRWSAIAAQLPGRTDNEIKNYWISHLSRRIHTIRKPNGEENVINLTNASAPPRRRRRRTSRATLQNNHTGNVLDDKDENPTLSNINKDNVAPQLSPTLDENFMFNPEHELGMEYMMGLDGLLLTRKEGCCAGSDGSGKGVEGVAPIGKEEEQCRGLAHASSCDGGGRKSPWSSILAGLDQFDGGIRWEMEIGKGDAEIGFQQGNEKEQTMSWLWDNDEDYFDVDFEEEQAMAAWLF